MYIFQGLYYLTNQGQDETLAQQIFGALYIMSFLLTCAIYRKSGGMPNWIVLLLPLSKRLHSIYALRLFNDCWSVLFVQAAMLAYQYELDGLATFLFR